MVNYLNSCSCNDTSTYACSVHSLMWGDVKMIHATTTSSGYTWAHIVEDYEAYILAKETDKDREERENKVKQEQEKRLDNLKEYKINKFVNRNTGCIVSKNGKPCKYANTKESIDSQGIRWKAGCEPHHENKCPYMHPDEPGYTEATNHDSRASITAYVVSKTGVQPPPPKPTFDSNSWRPIETPRRPTKLVSPVAPIKMRPSFAMLDDE